MAKVIELLLDRLLDKGILSICSMEDSFFLYKKLDKYIKLTEDIIYLNYIKESPFPQKDTGIIYILEHKNLYLWFYKKNIEKKLYLPESLLLFRIISLKYKNGIVIIDLEERKKILVIKEGVLVASFSKKNIYDYEVNLIKEEYFLSKVIKYTHYEYISILDNALRYLKYSDIIYILKLKIDLKDSLSNIIKWVSLPLLIVSFVLILILGVFDYYLYDKNQKLLNRYKNGKSTIVKIIDDINYYESLNNIFGELKKDFQYIDKVLVLSEVLRTIKLMDMDIIYFRAYDNKLEFIIISNKSEDIPIFIQDLFKSNLFEDIKNISSQKLRDKKTKTVINAILKKR